MKKQINNITPTTTSLVNSNGLMMTGECPQLVGEANDSNVFGVA